MRREGRRGESALIEQLLDLTSCLQTRLSKPCESQGVNASRFAVLRAIADVNDVGCSQTELADRLGLSESNVCSLVERLRSTGLLYRFRSKTDRRRSVLMLTDQGRQLAEAITLARNVVAVELMSVLDVGQKTQLQQLVQRLSEHLDSSSEKISEGVPSLHQATIDQPSSQTTRRAS